jgi:hypothetical protein
MRGQLALKKGREALALVERGEGSQGMVQRAKGMIEGVVGETRAGLRWELEALCVRVLAAEQRLAHPLEEWIGEQVAGLRESLGPKPDSAAILERMKKGVGPASELAKKIMGEWEKIRLREGKIAWEEVREIFDNGNCLAIYEDVEKDYLSMRDAGVDGDVFTAAGDCLSAIWASVEQIQAVRKLVIERTEWRPAEEWWALAIVGIKLYMDAVLVSQNKVLGTYNYVMEQKEKLQPLSAEMGNLFKQALAEMDVEISTSVAYHMVVDMSQQDLFVQKAGEHVIVADRLCQQMVLIVQAMQRKREEIEELKKPRVTCDEVKSDGTGPVEGPELPR